ncbi:ABC transporter permease [Phytoactinopolyspora halotolerans]|uniref:ABC transporter permease n=1 Tax=Phytoactinopolyspora halotolerans TaxID=1981512 RepID=A0A6L9S678_9ACTN|nr:ABC transporter permease [Phytoactinopolyspora halotolerans]NEE00517.1 ABC transporter permease [Phytoactinopolyspora halotolerans]
MGRYVLRRVLHMVPVLLGTTFAIYAMMWWLPADPLAGRCGGRVCPDSYVARMTEAYHLDDPLPVQYARYMLDLVTGDFGTTFSGAPVADELLQRFPVTLQLAGLAVVVEIVIGIIAGVLAGRRPGGFVDNLVLVSTLAVLAVPVFVLALTAQSVFGVQLGWFPVTSDGGFGSLILPAVVLGAVPLAFVARMMRATLIENLTADHVRTALAKGASERRAVLVHGVRNSLIPVATLAAADFGALVAGSVVVETVFNIDGVGGLLVRSVRDGEIGIVTTAVTLLVLLFLAVNLMADMLYPILDPRIRHA